MELCFYLSEYQVLVACLNRNSYYTNSGSHSKKLESTKDTFYIFNF